MDWAVGCLVLGCGLGCSLLLVCFVLVVVACVSGLLLVVGW